MSEKQEVQRLQIHYYFDDNSHSMNALVRNKAEKDLLEAINRIGEVTENKFVIQSEAYQEGGLVETFLFVFSGLGILKYLAPSINGYILHYLTRDKDLEDLNKQKIREEIKGLKLSNQEKEQVQLLEDKQAMRYVSNYYKKVDAYPKIKSIGFKNLENDVEYTIGKEQFKEFILTDNTTITEDDNSEIEIISPVLKVGRYKWKGKYLGEKIDFSMGDSKFKDDVIHSKHSFSNGITILCQLQISTTYDEFGDEKRKNYSVKKVYGIQPHNENQMRFRPIGVKKKKEDLDAGKVNSLFDKKDLE